ncbi:MAG: ABC transporter permease [Candidatus Jettenia caeni]|nr:MAG: ABC transporter permease [Candidatus Jettenia caeni]
MFYAKKIIYYSSLLLGIILFTFILFHMIPADPARIVLGPNADEQQVEVLRKELGLDKPLSHQLINYISKAIQFNFGESYIDKRPVFYEVLEKFMVSLVLVSFSLFFMLFYVLFVISCPPQIYWLIELLNFLFVSTPTFFIGVVVAILTFLFYPFTSFSGDFQSIADYLYIIPPAFVLALYPMSTLARILKQEVVKINNSPFIICVRAQGISELKIRFKHILKNILIPFLAALSNQLPMLFTGAFIVETIFSLPGIGSLLIKSILQKDFPMLEGIVMFNGSLFILINLLFETLYPIIDPRIKK